MFARIKPTPRLLVLAGALVGAAVGLSALAVAAPTERSFLYLLWCLLAVGMLAMGAFDARRALGFEPPECQRDLPPSLALGEPVTVALRLGAGELRGSVALVDHVPTCFETDGLPRTLSLPETGHAEVRYRVRPLERGEHRFGPVELLVPSPAGLFERKLQVDVTDVVQVLPNFVPVVRYALLAIENRVGELGIRLQRLRGSGLEFSELRDYVEGDSLRHVDWAATCRRQKLTTRVFQEEKDQHLLFLIDRGRRMHARDGELTHFDHTLNAVLLLSYVALRDGDSVGMLSFPGPERWLPPQRGVAAMRRVMAALYDLGTTSMSPDYLEAARRILSLHRRRALVVIVSNLRDEDSAELRAAISLLRRRHLVVFASLRETAIEEALRSPVDHYRQALLVASTHRYLEARERVHDLLRGSGALRVDAEPRDLPLELVNRYLEVKRSGRL